MVPSLVQPWCNTGDSLHQSGANQVKMGSLVSRRGTNSGKDRQTIRERLRSDCSTVELPRRRVRIYQKSLRIPLTGGIRMDLGLIAAYGR